METLNAKTITNILITVGKSLAVSAKAKATAYLYIIDTAKQNNKEDKATLVETINGKLSDKEIDKLWSAFRNWKHNNINEDGTVKTKADRQAKAKTKEAEQAEKDKQAGIYRMLGSAKDIVLELINHLSVREVMDVKQAIDGIYNFHAEEIQEIKANRLKVTEPQVGETKATVPIEQVLMKKERITISKRKARPDQKAVQK